MGDNADFANLLAAGVQQQITNASDPGYGVDLSSTGMDMGDPSMGGGYMPASYPDASDPSAPTSLADVGRQKQSGFWNSIGGIGSGIGQFGKAILPGITAAGQMAQAASERKYKEQQDALNRRAELIRAAIAHQAPAPHVGFAETPAVKVGGQTAADDPMARYVALLQGLHTPRG